MLLLINRDVVDSHHAFKSFDLGDCFLQRSRQQGHQLGLVDALVDGVAVSIHFILGASDAFRDNCLGFVGDKAVNRFAWVSNEVKPTGL
jgi:hypothetical protein